MIDVIASVYTCADSAAVWELISDFEGEWEPSNHEHKGTTVLTKHKDLLHDGLRWRQREAVGLLTGELTATVSDVEPERRFSWKGVTVYKPLGVTIRVEQGGDFRLEPEGGGTRMTHRVWGRFPRGLLGWIVEHIFGRLLRFEHAARRHTLVELEYFVGRLQGNIQRGERL